MRTHRHRHEVAAEVVLGDAKVRCLVELRKVGHDVALALLGELLQQAYVERLHHGPLPPDRPRVAARNGVHAKDVLLKTNQQRRR